jgi:hypothetical protein
MGVLSIVSRQRLFDGGLEAVEKPVILTVMLVPLILLAWLIIYHLRPTSGFASIEQAIKKLAVLTMTLLPFILLAWLIISHLSLKSGFASIEHGASQAEVVRDLGEPNSIVRCGSFGGHPPAGCVKEFSYLSILAFTDVWVVSFDSDDRAIRKLRYRSP